MRERGRAGGEGAVDISCFAARARGIDLRVTVCACGKVAEGGGCGDVVFLFVVEEGRGI